MKRLPIIILTLMRLLGQHLGDDVIRTGVNAFYNYEFDKSIKILSQSRVEFPENPVVHVSWAAARWRRNEAYLPQEEIYENLKNDLEQVEYIYELLHEKYPGNAEYLLYLGAARGLKARILLGQKQWFGTLSAAYKGFRLIRKAWAMDPNLKDAALPIGIVEYYAGLSNPLVKFGATLFGLNPSKEEGIKKMIIYAVESEWAVTEAKSILSFVFLWVDTDLKQALKISKSLAYQYPKNFDFQIHYVESLLQNGQLKTAKKRLVQLTEEMTRLTPQQKKWYTSYLNYEWGHYYFLTGENKKASHHLTICTVNYNAELDAILAFAYLRKGMVLDRQGHRDEAMNAYKACIEIDNYTSAITQAVDYFKNPYHREVVVPHSSKP